MMYLFLIIYMAAAAGYSGGSLPYSNILDREVSILGHTINFKWLPEALFAVPFGFMVPAWAFVPAAVWSYLWMQTATAPALHWGQGAYDPARTSKLKPFVDWLNAKTIKADPSTVEYCRLYMGVKWFLIGLPSGFGAPVSAVGAVLAYEGGARFKWHHGVTEALTGVAAALALIAGGI